MIFPSIWTSPKISAVIDIDGRVIVRINLIGRSKLRVINLGIQAYSPLKNSSAILIFNIDHLLVLKYNHVK